MFTEVLFLSAAQMKRLPVAANAVVVSILDLSEEDQRPSLEGFRDTLQLQFQDTYEEHRLAKVGSWADEPTAADHAHLARDAGSVIPALSHAQAMVEFIERHGKSPEPLSFIVHCRAGISRSGAVALWVSNRFNAPITVMKETSSANKRVLRLLNAAARQLGISERLTVIPSLPTEEDDEFVRPRYRSWRAPQTN